MTDPRNQPDQLAFSATILGRALLALGLIFSVGYLLVADYRPQSLAALVALFFGAYVWLRIMVYLENDRFTPKRYRVGITWALVGIDSDTHEFDERPVRVYFLLLAVLFVGLLVRPVLGWMLG